MLVYCCVLQFLQRVNLLAHALTCWLIMSIIKLFFLYLSEIITMGDLMVKHWDGSC